MPIRLRLIVLCFGVLVLGNCIGQPSDSTVADLKQAQTLINKGQFAEAEKLLEKLVQTDPQAGAAWFQLGSVRHTQKKWDAALTAHRKAADFPPFKPRALYNIACVYAQQQKADEAITSLQQAVAAGFADRGQMLIDTDLAELRRDKRFAALVPPLREGKDLFAEPVRLVHTWRGENVNDEFGWVARRIGDVDGDRVADFVTTAPGFNKNAGKIYVYSSRTGKLLFSRVGQAGQRYGNGAAGAGDVNADGVPDVIVGGPMAEGGYVEVLSGKDGKVLLSFKGEQAGGQFGYKVCGLGDLNGDGHADIAATALLADGTVKGCGRCVGYSGKDGRVLFTLHGERTGDNFGSAASGSQNAKHPMLIVGAQDAGPEQRGRVYVYRFQEGKPQLAFTITAEATGKELGMMFASFPGDCNNDGIPDVYCSDFSDSAKAPGAGRAFIYSGADGKKLLEVAGRQPGEGFGTSPSDAGDVDGDGVGDLVVGAWQNREQARSGGKVYLHSGADGRLLAAWTCRQVGDTFGFDATGLGDVDGDGHVDLLLTSAWSPVHGPKTGRVFIVAGPPLKPKK